MDKFNWIGNYEFKLVPSVEFGKLEHLLCDGWALISLQHDLTASIYIFARPKN